MSWISEGLMTLVIVPHEGPSPQAAGRRLGVQSPRRLQGGWPHPLQYRLQERGIRRLGSPRSYALLRRATPLALLVLLAVGVPAHGQEGLREAAQPAA